MSVGAIRAGRAMIEIFADSSMLARGLAVAQGRLAKFASNLRRLGTLSVAAGGAMAIPLIAATAQYAQIEQRLNTVRALTGAAGAEMQKLARAVREIGMASGMSFTSVADAMGELARAGVATDSLESATRAIAEFSRAAGIEMGSAANVVVQILTQFGYGMDHITHVTDVLQEMANATVSTVEDLADGFRYAGQTANLFGLSLEQAGAAIAMLQQSGLTASTAGTSLNQFLLQMVQNLDKLEAAIGGLRGADGEFLPFVEILNKLLAAVAAMPGPERLQFLNEMFDLRGMRGAEGLLQNVEQWIELTQLAENSMGATQRKADEMAKSFMVQFERMRNSVVMLGFSIGEALDGELRAWFKVISGTANGIAKFVSENKELVVTVARVAAGMVSAGVAFFTAGLSIQFALFAAEGYAKVISALLSPLRLLGSLAVKAGGMIVRMADTMMGFGRMAIQAAANVAVLAARVTAFLAINGWAAVLAYARGVVSVLALMGASLPVNAVLSFIAVAGALVGALGLIVTGANGVAAALGSAFGVIAYMIRGVVNGVQATASAAAQGAGKIFDGLRRRAGVVFPEILTMASNAWSGIAAALESGDLAAAWGIFVAAARAAFAQVMVIIGPFVDGVVEIFSQMASGIYSAFSAVASTVMSVISEIGAWLGTTFNQAADAGAEAIQWLGIEFGTLGESAEEAGRRILEALSAGDLVAAWAAAGTGLRKIFIQIAAWWDQYVGQRVRLFAQELGTWGRRDEIRDQAEEGRVRVPVEAIFDAADENELAAAVEEGFRHAERDNGGQASNAARRALRNAERLRLEELRAAGAMTPEQREADTRRQLDEAEADFQRDKEARDKRRREAEARRRREADVRKGEADARASAAQEDRANRKIEGDIASATRPEELDEVQQAIDDRRRAREAAERDHMAGKKPSAVKREMEMVDDTRGEANALLRGHSQTVDRMQQDGTITEQQAEAYRKQIEAAQQAVEAATTAEEAWNAVSDLRQNWADSGRENLPGVDRPQDPEQMQGAADSVRGRAEKAAVEMEVAQDSDDAARRQRSIEMRAEADEKRRAGDEAGARALERAADRLDQALDQREEADLQAQLEARRAELARQEELRNKAKDAGGGGQAAAKERRLDAVGGFVNRGFSQLGFGPNLGDQKRAADGIDRMVAIMERNEGNAGVFA